MDNDLMYIAREGPAYNPIGLPIDPSNYGLPPGFQGTEASISPAPKISSAQNWWDDVKQNSQSALSWASEAPGKTFNWAEDEIKSAYNTTKSAVGTVLSDVTSPMTNALQSTFWYLIIGLVVVAGGLYFIGKTGAIKANVNV